MKRNWKNITSGMAMIFAFIAISLAPLAGCQSTPQKIAVNTLTTLGQGVNDSYEGLLYCAVTGGCATNDIPQVTAYYREFQAGFGVAAASAHFATNTTLATPELLNLAARVTTAISTIKAKGK